MFVGQRKYTWKLLSLGAYVRSLYVGRMVIHKAFSMVLNKLGTEMGSFLVLHGNSFVFVMK